MGPPGTRPLARALGMVPDRPKPATSARREAAKHAALASVGVVFRPCAQARPASSELQLQALGAR
jgi:hypothetical protein